MPPLHHFLAHLKLYKFSHKYLWAGALMIFFWSVFDGMVTYVTPLVITKANLSATVMGLIVGTSSVTGAAFDILLSLFLKNTHYRRLYMIMIALCFVFPLLLSGHSIWFFLLAMAVWGIYFDLYNWATFDFVSRTTNKDQHASGFGIIEIFHALGYFIAPIIAGLVITETIENKTFFLMWIIIAISACFYITLVKISKKRHHKTDEAEKNVYRKRAFFVEFGIWKKVGRKILPVLLFTLLMNITQAFFWTIGPLYAESLSDLHPFGSLFIIVYSLPQLLVGLAIGSVTKHFGKKRSALISFLIGGVLMLGYFLVSNVLLILALTFIASIFLAFSWPVIHAVYVDYISETQNREKEISGVADFFINIGYIVGPVLAGIFYDMFAGKSFAYLGGVIIVVVLILLKVTPRHITIPSR